MDVQSLQGLYSISGKTSYHKTSWILQDVWLDAKFEYRFQIWQAAWQQCCRDVVKFQRIIQRFWTSMLRFDILQHSTAEWIQKYIDYVMRTDTIYKTISMA